MCAYGRVVAFAILALPKRPNILKGEENDKCNRLLRAHIILQCVASTLPSLLSDGHDNFVVASAVILLAPRGLKASKVRHFFLRSNPWYFEKKCGKLLNYRIVEYDITRLRFLGKVNALVLPVTKRIPLFSILVRQGLILG